MTPAREQVIEWAEEAGITSDDAACQIHDLTQLATLAMAAGRDQGLREAADAVRSKTRHADDPDNCVWTAAYDHVAAEHVAAIEQLRACGSAATPG